jgi:hypothetical protein
MSIPNPGKHNHSVGIIGVRDFRGSVYKNEAYVIKVLMNHLVRHNLSMRDIAIFTGGGKGVEEIIVKWAESNGIPVTKISPRIRELGPESAFKARNGQIVASATHIVVFWDGYAGTIPDSIGLAMHMNKVATIYPLSAE